MRKVSLFVKRSQVFRCVCLPPLLRHGGPPAPRPIPPAAVLWPRQFGQRRPGRHQHIDDEDDEPALCPAGSTGVNEPPGTTAVPRLGTAAAAAAAASSRASVGSWPHGPPACRSRAAARGGARILIRRGARSETILHDHTDLELDEEEGVLWSNAGSEGPLLFFCEGMMTRDFAGTTRSLRGSRHFEQLFLNSIPLPGAIT